VYNVDSALFCALPYHGTPQFVRLVQVLQVEGSRWAFLAGVKVEGAAPTREALSFSISRNAALMSLMCEGMLDAASGAPRGAPGASLMFYALLISDALGGMSHVPEAVVPKLLPCIESGFISSASTDHRAGALMLGAQLVTRAQLAPEFSAALLEGMAKSSRAPLELPALQAMLQVTRTHLVAALPRKAVTYLVKVPELAPLLAALAARFPADSFVSALLAALVLQLERHSTYCKALLDIVRVVKLQPLAAQLTSRLLLAGAQPTAAASAEQADIARACCVSALHKLQQLYPAEVDAAVNSILGANGSSESVCALARSTFGGTVASPLGDYGVTLTGGLDHASARIRESALHQLQLLLSKADGASLSASLPSFRSLRAVLLCRLADADAEVSAAAISLPRLAQLVGDDEALFHAAEAALWKSVAAISVSEHSFSAHVRVAKRGLTLIASLAAASSSLSDRTASILLGCSLNDAGVKAVAQEARQLAASHKHPFFQCLEAQTQKSAGTSILLLQHAFVSGLAEAFLAHHDEAFDWAMRCMRCLSLPAQHTVLLALLQANSRTIAEVDAPGRLAESTWMIVRTVPAQLAAAPAATSWADGLPSEEHLQLFCADAKATVASVQLRLLSVLVDRLPFSLSQTIPFPPSLGDLGLMLSSLALHPDPVAEPLIAKLTERAAETFGAGSVFLSLVASAESSSSDAAAQCAAIRLLGKSMDFNAVPHLLIALAHPRRSVRDASLAVLAELLTAPSKGRQSRAARAQSDASALSLILSPWIAANHDTIRAGGSVVQLLRDALRDGSASPLSSFLLDRLQAESFHAHAAASLVSVFVGSGNEQGAARALHAVWTRLLSRGAQPEDIPLALAILSVFSAAAADSAGEGASLSRAAILGAVHLQTLPLPLLSALLDSLSVGLLASLSLCDSHALLPFLILLHRRGSDAQCRAAVRSVLERMPILGADFARVVSSCTLGKELSKRARGEASVAAEPPVSEEALELLAAALETLQWRSVADPEQLLDAVSSALASLLDAMARMQVTDDSLGQASETILPAGFDYLLQLALQTLTRLLSSCPSGVRVDVPLMVRALHQAPDANVRKYAIELLAAAATAERAMEEVLSILLALTSSEAVSVDDGDGARILHEAFAAVAPCWVRGHGGSGAQLLVHVIDALPRVPDHRRLQLLSALLRSLPSPEALTVSLQLLLSAACKADSPLAPDSALSLAAVLCSSRPALECMHAWCSLLQNHSALGDNGLQAAAAFVASELQVADTLSWYRARANDAAIQTSTSSLIGGALSLQRRGDVRRAELVSSDRKGVQALLLATEGLMPPMQYLMTVARLFEVESRYVQRSALKLFSAKVHKFSAPASEVEAAEACSLVDSIVPLLRAVDTLQSASGRAALEAFSALAERYGASDSFETALVRVLPIVLAAASDVRAPVAAASLLCIASAVSALSTRVIPLLPRLVPIVLDVLEGSKPDPDSDVRVAAALTTLLALVDKLDAFLSPFLARANSLLVGGHLMHDQRSPEVAAKAAAVRALLAERLPARVLMEPLLASWDVALPCGRAACVALLQQLQTLAEALDAGEAAGHCDAIFGACPCALPFPSDTDTLSLSDSVRIELYRCAPAAARLTRLSWRL